MRCDSAHEAVWTAVHAALDARRSPLDDAAVLAALDRAPAALPEIAALCASLRALPSASPRTLPRRARRVWRFLPAAAAAALLLVFWPRASAPPTEQAQLAAAGSVTPDAHASEAATDSEPAPRGSVLLARSEATRAWSPKHSAGILDHRQLVSVTRP